jgi:hypothetical protein
MSCVAISVTPRHRAHEEPGCAWHNEEPALDRLPLRSPTMLSAALVGLAKRLSQLVSLLIGHLLVIFGVGKPKHPLALIVHITELKQEAGHGIDAQ